MTIKILYVIDKMVRAGAQSHLCQAVAGLDRNCFEPVLCCLLFPGPLAEELNKSGLPVYSLGLNNILGWRFPRAIRGLSRIIRMEKIRIVHSYLFSANIVSPFSGLINRISVITSRRDDGFWMGERHVQAQRFCNLLTDRITANSRAVVAYLLAREKAAPGKVVLIHNGLNVSDFRLRSPGEETKPRKIVLGSLGNIRPVKGYEYLLEALQNLDGGSLPLELRIGGRVLDREYYQRLLAAAGHPKLRGKISFCDEVTDVGRFLSGLDIFVLPSLSEGFSNALLEAMAASLAVVATEAGGNREILRDGREGLLVPPADSVALASALERLLREPSLRSALGIRARKRVESDFSAGKMCRKLEALYREVLARGNV